MKCKYRIVVSIDGGGIRGIVPLKILKTIQELSLKFDPTLDICSLVDIFSASSTGSVIGGALMLQDDQGKSLFTPSTLFDFYLKHGTDIFDTRHQFNIQDSSYSLPRLMDRYFGNITLEEVKKHFLYVSYDLNTDKQFLFTDTMSRLKNVSVSKMMQGCSAMPGICPPLEHENSLLVDGMLATKNPSVLAYNYAKLLYPNDPIVLVSLGTGKTDEEDYGTFEHDMKKVDDRLYIDAKNNEELIYFRFQPTISSASNDFENASTKIMVNLLEDTEHYIRNHESKFNRLLSLIKIKAGNV